MGVALVDTSHILGSKLNGIRIRLWNNEALGELLEKLLFRFYDLWVSRRFSGGSFLFLIKGGMGGQFIRTVTIQN